MPGHVDLGPRGHITEFELNVYTYLRSAAVIVYSWVTVACCDQSSA